ncbi:PREDICTED: uncharacterized protein LOC105452633 isoform X2 [Wasmannia auropunctata]|nr:PREDICTED: uncharacterized protein LOC105452633 isoform X2 [Wasmannia auropunctata]
MLVRAPYSFLFILTICCWLRYNAAIPLVPHSNPMQDAFKEKKTVSQIALGGTTLNSRSRKATLDVTSDETRSDVTSDEKNDENDEDDEIQNNINRNVNVNMNVFHRGKRHRIGHNRDKHKRHKQSTTENIMTVVEQEKGHRLLEEIAKEKISTNCASSNKKNQRYSSSFLENTTDSTLTVEKEFHDVVGNNSKVKRSGSVHEGEDITLCWIETTTIKEDKAIQPPKRLVIREYTISFENSATIPERYLECKRFEGELTADDPDIGKTALFEIIDEDTMVSRIVNFTSVSHVGNVITWQHKKVKCGVGPVVSKNIVELNDGSKNPKKRVEIKVSPKMHQLTATTTEEEPCTETSEKIDESSTLTETITEHTTGLSCENTESGACEATMTLPSSLLKNEYKFSTTEGEIIEEETTKKTVTELQHRSESESEEDRLFTDSKLLTPLGEVEVKDSDSRRSTTLPKILTTIEESEEKNIDCEENSSDPACLMQIYSTPSSKELFPELVVTTETTTISETISSREVTTREVTFYPSVEKKLDEMTQSSSREEKETSELVIEETTPFAPISMESSEAPQSTDQAFIDTSSLETEIMTSTSEESKLKEGSGEGTEWISEELEKIDHVSSASIETVTSGKDEIGTDVITERSSIEFSEFEKTEKRGQILDKVTQPPISTENITGTVIIESESTMSEEVPSEESKETTAIEGMTTVELKTSEEEEFMSTITSPTKIIKSTTLSSTISGEVGLSCEECAEGCDESGNCIETITKCDSEVCPEEESTEAQSKFDITSSPIQTKVSPFVTDLEPSEEVETIETATTTLTSRESESIWTIPETRRSTTISTPQHKLTLKVKVLLEHINENKEKHNLVEVEKHLLLDENPEHHINPNILEQLKSLNDSVNMETMSALLNCTSLSNLTRGVRFISKKPNDVFDVNDADLEYTNSEFENSISQQFTSESADASNDYSEYQEQEVSSRRRRRRSLDDKMEDLNKFVKQNLSDPTDSVVDSFNISQSNHTELMNDDIQLSTTTLNYSEEEINGTESERNLTREDQSTMPSTTVSISYDVDLSNTSESHDANLTMENVQLTTTTYNPTTYNLTTYNPTTYKEELSEEETSSAVYVESEKNITNEKNESVVPSISDISNETKMEVVRRTLPGIQEDVVVGMQDMISKLTENNLNPLNKVKEAIKTNILGILTPRDAHLRRRRAATGEVGHWSNERIKEAPMGGNLRSLTEFTLYKVLP